MIALQRRNPGNSALGPALVIWGFGYLLVDIFAFLAGRSAPGLLLATSIPLFALGVAFTLLLDWARQRLLAAPPLLRWPLLALAVVAATAAQSLIDLNYLKWLALTVFPDWQAWALNLGPQRLFAVALLYLWTFGLALTLLWAAGISSAAHLNAVRADLFEAASHRAEAAALRLQLNPHFLFNTLNSIASLVTLDRKPEAEEMIGQLADFLRASLDSDPMGDVPLSDEIDMIDAYLGIECARFGARLRVEIDAPDAVMDALVPNFILQPLVENAIKHGVSATRGGATIAITAARDGDALVLGVVNTALRPDEAARAEAAVDGHGPAHRTGIGLANIRQRLAIGYGERAALETGAVADGYRAVIRLPYLARAG